MDEFFSYASKAIFVIPIILVILALVFKLNQAEQNIKPIVAPTQKLTLSPTKKISQLNFNLEGPFVCNFSDKTSSISAFIKNKKIFVKKEENKILTNFLINNDCLYFWEDKKYSGEKFCGVSSYLSFFENFPSFLSLTNFGFNSNQLNFLNFCQKKEIKDDKIFEVPVKILFKNNSWQNILKK